MRLLIPAGHSHLAQQFSILCQIPQFLLRRHGQGGHKRFRSHWKMCPTRLSPEKRSGKRSRKLG